MIDAIILDLGNVLAFHDNEKLFFELGRTFQTTPAALKQRLEGTNLWPRVNAGHFAGDALRLELSRHLGFTPTRAEFERAWSCHFSINAPMVKLVESWVGQVKLVLLSNTHDLHVAHLRPQLPLLEKFEALVLSCEVGHLKPDPAIYALAVKAAGVPPSRAVFFDDIEAYVTGAKAAGLNAHVFREAAEVPAQLEALGFSARR